MGLAPICSKSQREQLKSETYRTIPVLTPIFSHWSMPLRSKKEVNSTDLKKCNAARKIMSKIMNNLFCIPEPSTVQKC
jgi:hypothetical protein